MANEAVSSPPRRGSGRGQSHRDVHATTTDHHPPQAQSTNRSRSRSRDREPQPLNPVRCFAATRYAEFDGEDEPSIDEMIADAEEPHLLFSRSFNPNFIRFQKVRKAQDRSAATKALWRSFSSKFKHGAPKFKVAAGNVKTKREVAKALGNNLVGSQARMVIRYCAVNTRICRVSSHNAT